MKIIRSINIKNATITALSENPLYNFDIALIDSRLSRYGQTLTDTAQWIKFEYSSAIDVDIIGIFGNNFTTTATVKIQANTTDVWTSPSIDQALTYTKDGNASIDLERDVGVWSHQFSSTQSYKYWRIYVDDSSNPDTYLKIGFIFMDEELVMPGMSVNQIFTSNTNSKPITSTSGQTYGIKRLKFNGAAFNFPIVTETQKTAIDKFYYNVDIVEPYMCMVWEDSLDVQRPLYVVNTTLPEWGRVEVQGGLNWTYSNEIKETY